MAATSFRAYFKGFQLVGHIGGAKSRGDGMGKLLSFSYTNMWVGGIASAEGAKLRLPKARSPSRLGDLGERRKPSKPETDSILNTSSQKWSTFWDPGNLTFFKQLNLKDSIVYESFY